MKIRTTAWLSCYAFLCIFLYVFTFFADEKSEEKINFLEGRFLIVSRKQLRLFLKDKGLQNCFNSPDESEHFKINNNVTSDHLSAYFKINHNVNSDPLKDVPLIINGISINELEDFIIDDQSILLINQKIQDMSMICFFECKDDSLDESCVFHRLHFVLENDSAAIDNESQFTVEQKKYLKSALLISFAVTKIVFKNAFSAWRNKK